MSSSALALVGYATWTLALLLVLAGLRTHLTVTGKRAANSFHPSGEDVSPFSARLCRAHANCYEFFPIFGGLIAAALLTGNAAVTDPLAGVVLGARLGQSGVHLISTSNAAVTVRFGFFGVQVAIALYWALRLLAAGLG